MGIQTQELRYSADRELLGYTAFPDAEGPVPGVLVVHEWWGHNDYVRNRAEQLAELGYAAMAIDMYGAGEVADNPTDATALMNGVFANIEAGIARFRAAREVLANSDRVDATKISAIGYCFGGAVVLHMARVGVELASVASFHPGTLATGVTAAAPFPPKVLVCVGEDDPMAPSEQRDAFEDEMKAAKADYELVTYPNVAHGFSVEAATERGKKYGMPLAFDEDADSDSWSRLKTLLASI